MSPNEAAVETRSPSAGGPPHARLGSLFLVPNALDLGTPAVETPLDEVLPRSVLRVAARLDHWVVENAKSARLFLKRVDAVTPLARPLQALSIVELPRPPKGRASPADAPSAVAALLAPVRQGTDLGLLSEAGLPAVADPGASLVAAAQAAGVTVVALPGPSALTLALAASGLNGQSFQFLGYLPAEPLARAARIRELDALSRRLDQTQVVIETPYRNAALLQALVAHLQPSTRLAVSSGLSLPDGWSRTDRVSGWPSRGVEIAGDVPAVFAWLADQAPQGGPKVRRP